MTRRIALNFHGIGEPQRPMEPGEATFWVSTALLFEILDRVAASPDPATYALTFDDGNLSDHDIALPALQERGLAATFFVLTGRIGAAGSLDLPHIRALQDAGMTIGSHGVGHVAWTGLADAGLLAELAESRDTLEAICSQKVAQAGIPFGRYDARVLRAVKAAGYEVAWSSDGGGFDPNDFLRPRTSLRGDMDGATLDAILGGHMPTGKRLRRHLGLTKRRWFPLR